jgi:hypothetical protein
MKIDVLKRNAGGPSHAKILRSLKRGGFKARTGVSKYRMHGAIVVQGPLTKKDQKRVKVIIFPDTYAPGVRRARVRGRRAD